MNRNYILILLFAGLAVGLVLLAAKSRRNRPDRSVLRPFHLLPDERFVGTPDLPDDLRKFYTRYEGFGLESGEDRPDRFVRLCLLSEVKQITWKDIHIFGQDPPPPGWENFSGLRIGFSLGFDELIYVQSAPVCGPGSILAFGIDVAGPGGSGNSTIDCTLVLASGFDKWIENMMKYGWSDLGLCPGSRKELPESEHRQLIDYFKSLNPRSHWKDAKPDKD